MKTELNKIFNSLISQEEASSPLVPIEQEDNVIADTGDFTAFNSYIVFMSLSLLGASVIMKKKA